jgi:hypothetical protein
MGVAVFTGKSLFRPAAFALFSIVVLLATSGVFIANDINAETGTEENNAPVTYTVNYYRYNNGIINYRVPVYTQTVEAGGSVILMDPEEIGITSSYLNFTGWWVEGGESNKVIQPAGSLYSPTKNNDVYAQWENKYFYVYFGSSGGTGGMTPDTVRNHEVYEFPESLFTPPSGMTFEGWKIDGKGETYAPGTKITPTNDFTLYAQYGCSGEVYTVSYEGYLFIPPQTVCVGSSLRLLQMVEGVCSGGYHVWRVGETDILLEGGSMFTPESDVTLYETWVEVPCLHTTDNITLWPFIVIFVFSLACLAAIAISRSK